MAKTRKFFQNRQDGVFISKPLQNLRLAVLSDNYSMSPFWNFAVYSPL